MSDTNKQTLVDIWKILIVKDLKEVHQRKRRSCIQNLQIDFIGVLWIAQ